MRRALSAAVLLSLAFPASAGAAGFSAKSFGEGGGYTHPSAEAGDYLENAPRREHPAPAPEAKPRRERRAARPERPMRPAGPRRRDTARSGPRAAAGRASSSASGRVERSAAPAPLPARRPASLAALAPPPAPSDDEDASAAGAQAYDGQAEAPALETPRPRGGAPADGAARPEGRRDGELFVSVELDPGESGSLRDAVSGLGMAGFTQDHRFDARPGAGRASIVTGWLPASRLGEAVTRPGVRRVSIETARKPAPRPGEVEGAFLIGLRVPAAAGAAEAAAPALAELARDAGLRGARVLGVETAADGGAIAIVAGSLPLSRLSKAMMRPDVIRLVPAPSGLPLAGPRAPTPPSPGGFARFVAHKGLWLVLLTVAAALLPAARSGVGRGLRALVPYH